MPRVTPEAAREYERKQLEQMVTPPEDVLNRPPARADVAAFPVYFILGPGAEAAASTECDHGYYLTDSCPGCDYDAEQEASR